MNNQEQLMMAAEKLKKRHIKNTPQRQVILAYLMSSKEHPSIVYNTLELFMDRKLIIEVTPDNEGHMRYDYFAEPHYHVICVNCNKIIDVPNDEYVKLEKDAAEKTGFKVFNSQYEVYGLCPECQAKIAD